MSRKHDIKILDVVELIASGYEFVCPECDELNKVIEVTEIVTCLYCNTKYKVGEYYHATG